MVFNPADYSARDCMRVRTKEEFEWLCRELASMGRRWSSGLEYDSDKSLQRWEKYRENTYVYFNCGYYENRARLHGHPCTILEASEFVLQEDLDESEFSLDVLIGGD